MLKGISLIIKKYGKEHKNNNFYLNKKLKTESSQSLQRNETNRSTNISSIRHSYREQQNNTATNKITDYSHIQGERKEKKFNLEDFVELEDQIEDLQRNSSDELKDFFEGQWDIDYLNKGAKDILNLFEINEIKSSIPIANINSQDKDYLLLLQNQESIVRQVTRIQVYSEKLKNSENQFNYLTQYAQKEMEDIKQEFQNSINDLKQREQDISHLKSELNRKNSELQSLEERIVSILILEHKIKQLGDKNIKDIQKVVQEYTQKMKEADKECRILLFKEKQQNLDIIQDFKFKLNIEKIENRKLAIENKQRIQQLNDIISQKDIKLQQNVSNLQSAQEKLALKNKHFFITNYGKDKFGVVV